MYKLKRSLMHFSKNIKTTESEPENSKKIKMSFKIVSKAGSRARHGILQLAHGNVETPVFMPVGTQGLYKGILKNVFIFCCETSGM